MIRNMKRSLFAFALLGGLFFVGCSSDAAKNAEATPTPADQTSKQLVLAELYTSQGCPNCPNAERMLTFINNHQPVKNAEIVTLSFHVDYMDRGMKDEYGSAINSERQKWYAAGLGTGDRIYTPQLIVDGKEEMHGADINRIRRSAGTSAETTKGKVGLTLDGDKLNVEVSDLPANSGATAFLALAESDLRSQVIAKGPGGADLVYASVVRDWSKMGSFDQGEASRSFSADLKFDTKWKRENVSIVVFVQENATRRILAVGKIKA